MTRLTRIEPQYARQGHIFSLKVGLENDTNSSAFVKVGVSVTNQEDSFDSPKKAKYEQLFVMAKQKLEKEIILDNPILII